MERLRSRRPVSKPPPKGPGRIESTAKALADLALSLAAEWNGMDDSERNAIVRSIRELALELDRLTDERAPDPAPTAHEADTPWFGGLSFLTPREHEVLVALARGASTRSIGQRLGISTGTVRSHVKSVLVKLGVHSRVEAVSLLLTWDAHQKRPA